MMRAGWTSGLGAVVLAFCVACIPGTTTPGGSTTTQAGTSTTTTTSGPGPTTTIPGPGSPLATVTEVSAGYAHACAVLVDTTVACWGRNNSGQLGDGTTNDSSSPVKVTGLFGVTRISAGSFHTCALLDTGRIKCWGASTYGQLGRAVGDTTPLELPSLVADLVGVIQISAGTSHTCAVRLDHTAWCWGQNWRGQLGTGSGGVLQSEPRPVLVAVPPGGDPSLNSFESITAGRASTCGHTTAQFTACWGANSSGELGDLTTTDSPYPVLTTPGVSAAGGLAVGAESACATHGGLVACWGRNDVGQLGNGTFTGTVSAVAADVSGATSLSVGGGTACVTGPARCWGDNVEGQLGIGTFTLNPPTGSNTPAPVLGLPAQPAQIDVGETFVCAVTPDTHVWCWGSNSAGQLGVATPVQSASPVEVTFQ